VTGHNGDTPNKGGDRRIDHATGTARPLGPGEEVRPPYMYMYEQGGQGARGYSQVHAADLTLDLAARGPAYQALIMTDAICRGTLCSADDMHTMQYLTLTASATTPGVFGSATFSRFACDGSVPCSMYKPAVTALDLARRADEHSTAQHGRA
jgi:hypothetical protein